jgi:hypothetical protein
MICNCISLCELQLNYLLIYFVGKFLNMECNILPSYHFNCIVVIILFFCHVLIHVFHYMTLIGVECTLK